MYYHRKICNNYNWIEYEQKPQTITPLVFLHVHECRHFCQHNQNKPCPCCGLGLSFSIFIKEKNAANYSRDNQFRYFFSFWKTRLSKDSVPHLAKVTANLLMIQYFIQGFFVQKSIDQLNWLKHRCCTSAIYILSLCRVSTLGQWLHIELEAKGLRSPVNFH